MMLTVNVIYVNSCWSQWDICGRSKLSTSCLNSGCMSNVEILSKDCTWTSVRLERRFVLLMLMVENVCSQMYVDPNRTSSFMAIFLRLATLSCTTGNSLRASQNPVTGRVRPVGRMWPVPVINVIAAVLFLTPTVLFCQYCAVHVNEYLFI